MICGRSSKSFASRPIEGAAHCWSCSIWVPKSDTGPTTHAGFAWVGLKSSDPVAGNDNLRRATKRSVKQVKRAIAEADNLAKRWTDQVERVTDT